MKGIDQVDLWGLIGKIYTQPEYEELCLRLQDAHGFDVSLGLAAVVYGLAGHRWSADAVDRWHEHGWSKRSALASALRHARRQADAADPAMAMIRAAVLHQELAAERLAVDWLEQEIGAPPPAFGTDRTAALHNLRLVAGTTISQELLDPLVDIERG